MDLRKVLLMMALWALLTGCAAQAAPVPSGTGLLEETGDSGSLPQQSGETAEEPEISPYAGTWQDPEAPGCRIEIGCADGVNYTVNITWSGDTGDAVWEAAGVYDSVWEGVYYLGTRNDVHTNGDGIAVRTLVHEEATGLLYFEEDGVLVWLDDFDHMGEGLRFSNSEVLPVK